jgi:hypothetical protein
VTDRVWRSDRRAYIRPLPQQLNISSRGKSRRLQRVLTDFGIEQSFAQAAERVREHYGIQLGATVVRAATLEHAQRAEQHLGEQYKEPFRLLPAHGVQHVIAEADGTMICTVAAGPRTDPKPREWKEMRLLAAQAKDSVTTVYAASFGTVDQAGRQWGHCARTAGWSQNTSIHAVGDGAEWIRLQTREVFGPQGTFLCDFFHVSEYLAAAAERCRPERPHQWRHTQQKRLRQGEVQKVIDALSGHMEGPDVPDEEAPVRNGHRYLSNRIACVDYPGAIQRGLPIGSGMIESGHRHVLHARLKKAGAAWLSTTASSMAHLRVLRANKQWTPFWN